jgi:hypothetical protein
MSKKRLLLALAVCWPSYSYSESITPYYGATGNAAANGYTWSMDNVLPEPPGLDINGVIYDYTIQKDVNDSVNVHVQNENANGTGYIFRETDEWQPGSLGGTEIRKVVPVIPGIPRAAWGDGSIEVEGNGTVEDANVRYTYKVDPCFDPQSNPSCPGYQIQLPDIEVVDVNELYDATEDEAVRIATEETDSDVYEDNDRPENEDEEDEEEREIRLEKALAAADASALFAEAVAQAQILASINMAVNMTSYYASNVPGGEYKETVVLVDRKIEDNKRGLRNGLAQQLLHEEMIRMQYNN